MPASALLSAASAVRAASLNLCTDEYLLLLAEPREIVSVSYLVARPAGISAVARWRGAFPPIAARSRSPAARPSLVLTRGGGGRATACSPGGSVSAPSTSPYARSLDGRREQSAQGRGGARQSGRAQALAASGWPRLRSAPRPPPATRSGLRRRRSDSRAGSLGAQWLRLAGLEQRPLPGGRVTLETLLTKPPKMLIRAITVRARCRAVVAGSPIRSCAGRVTVRSRRTGARGRASDL